MSSQSSSLDLLRQLARARGVDPTDDDLRGVAAFMDVLLPALDRIERELPPGTAPAGLYLPDGDA